MQLTESMITSWSIPELCDRFDQHVDEHVRLFAQRVRGQFEHLGKQEARHEADKEELEARIDELKDKLEEAHESAKA